MEKYNPNAECIKCGGNLIDVYYCNSHTPNRYAKCYKIETDHLHRRCGKCTYEWIEECLGIKGGKEIE